MSIDFLYDLERDLDAGKDFFAVPGIGRNQWVIARTVDDLRRPAQRTVDHKKISVNIVRLLPVSEAVAGNYFLVPTRIGDPGARGEPNIEWSTVETKEAAEMMRDVRHGPSPFFGMQVEETIEPPEV
ncbi:MAG: hypothetical protein KDD42_03050 [Bdellovibrionales bacterium]|nr:hypothetical protein [Bdellovibrionales bacterium]